MRPSRYSTLAFNRENAFAAFQAWMEGGQRDQLVAAWRAMVPLLERRARDWSNQPGRANDTEEVAMALAESLFERLADRRIPLLPDPKEYAAYVVGAARRWRADALRELATGREIPSGYQPQRSPLGHPMTTENQIFMAELPDAAKKAILTNCRFDDSFKLACAYVLDQWCRGDRVCRDRVSEIWGHSRYRLVIDFCELQFRRYLEPIRHLLQPPMRHYWHAMYDDEELR